MQGRQHKPSRSDRAYNPTKDNIKNHVYRAKKAFELFKYDQHNLELKLKCLEDDSSSSYMFRPFKQAEESDKSDKWWWKH